MKGRENHLVCDLLQVVTLIWMSQESQPPQKVANSTKDPVILPGMWFLMQPWSQLLHPCWALQPSPGTPTSLRCVWGRQEGQNLSHGVRADWIYMSSAHEKGECRTWHHPAWCTCLTQASRGDTRRIHQAFLLLGLALHSLHAEVLRGACSSPGIRSPIPASSAGSQPARCLGAGLLWAAWEPRQET